jgi:hypothetical protein
MRRFGATLFPSTWARDAEPPGAGVTLQDPDAALDGWARAQVDPSVSAGLADLRSRLARDLRSLEQPLAAADRGLGQLLDSVAGKIDFQVRRLEEAVLARARRGLFRRDPELAHLRELLRPRGRLQERVLTMWTPLLYEGDAALRAIDEAVEQWFARGENGHALLCREPEER